MYHEFSGISIVRSLQSLASTWFTIIRTSNRIKNSSRNKQIGRRKQTETWFSNYLFM